MNTYGTTYGDVLDALGDPTRRAILELVAERPRAVSQLADRLPVSRPAVSQHLRILKDAQLVRDQPDGTRRIYHLDAGGVAVVRAYLDRFWEDALGRFAADIEDHDTGEAAT